MHFYWHTLYIPCSVYKGQLQGASTKGLCPLEPWVCFVVGDHESRRDWWCANHLVFNLTPNQKTEAEHALCAISNNQNFFEYDMNFLKQIV